MMNLLLAVALVAAPAKRDLAKGDLDPTADGGAPAKKAGIDASKLPFTNYSIQLVVKSHLPDVQACYDQVVLEIGGKKPPEGRVLVKFSILANGLTTETKVDRKKSTLKNDRVWDCVTDEIRRWEFPNPTDQLEHPIEYPFDLKVAKEK
jgi:hypothetical protein